MRIGWRALIRNKLKAKSDSFTIGIAIDEDAVTFCALQKRKSNELALVHESVVSLQNWPVQLKKWVESHGLSGANTHIAFSVAWYQQVQVDRPAVEEDEMDGALKWAVEEILGSGEARAYDYFDLPVPLAGNNKINIVAVNETAVVEAAEACYGANLQLQSISVEEVVTCNLPVGTELPVLTLIQEAGDEVCLNIVKNGELYFSRRLKGFENLSSFSAEELRMGIADSLCVQIQRSMDYFESQLRQAPISHIRIKMDSQYLDTLVEQVQQAVPAQIEIMRTGVTIPEQLNELRLSYTALGAALQQVSQGQTA
ncbi:MSHA biogenesis protein MshI [Alteromonas sediminis]|uniref:MSHA biogenesis protein MshI n=1 Tax=Alteromonas sediminis TaxID=2259342 RepID=A0A3N5Z8I7_9ALTE|nr:MSHA biogenesis protein MshI [Alteromonas sediminis]RPJ65338.1 MSHA biogenesis protein MshI [Alteromonas sediminis]